MKILSLTILILLTLWVVHFITSPQMWWWDCPPKAIGLKDCYFTDVEREIYAEKGYGLLLKKLDP